MSTTMPLNRVKFFTTLTAVLSVMFVLSARNLSAQMVASLDGASDKVHVSTVWQYDQTKAGGQTVLAVVFDIQENWHIASDDAQVVPGDFTPYTTKLAVKSDNPQLTFGPVQYPEAHKLKVGGMPDPIAVFDGRPIIYLPITINDDVEPGEVEVVVQVDYQACDDMTCDFPQTVITTATLKVVGPDTEVEATEPSPLFDGFDPKAFDAMAGIPEATWPSPDGSKLQAQAIWQKSQLRPGGLGVIALVVDIQPDWHIASDADQAVEVEFDPVFTEVTTQSDDPSITFGSPQFPEPHQIAAGGMPDPIAVFDGRTVIYLPVKIASDTKPGKINATVNIQYQACDDKACDFPTTVSVPVSVEVIAPDAEGTAAPGPIKLFDDFDASSFQQFGGMLPPDVNLPGPPSASSEVDFGLIKIDSSSAGGFLLVLLMTAIGGALLNFTPCVLPVIPIKILGLAQTAGNRRKTLALGTVMAGGVIAFWLGLGVAIASISGFTASNQLFQYPAFSISVGIIIAVLAIGMCGLFSVRLPNFVYAINPRHDSYSGAFGFGIMTAVLSTPCTAPFMGGAAFWAASQPPVITLTIFATIGFGMALPYFILSANPKLVDALPRTGPGSELLKQVMGLLMLAAAAFFVGAGISGLLSDGTEAAPKGHWWVVGAIVAAAGGWLIYRVFRITPSYVKRGAFTVLGLVLIVLASFGAASLSHESAGEDAPINWVYYTPDRLDKALADGNVVLLDFTADWCANCHALELTVLNSADVSALLKEKGYVAMKVDLTGNYADGKQKLWESGSVAIPWLVVYAPDGTAVFKADWYTAGQLVDALQQAAG